MDFNWNQLQNAKRQVKLIKFRVTPIFFYIEWRSKNLVKF